MDMRSLFTLLPATAFVASLAACSDVSSPVDGSRAVGPTGASHLLAPDENQRTIADSTDANGNHIMVVEYAAGTLPTDPVTGAPGGSVASVTIRTSIPFSPIGSSSSGACITSTIDHVETTPGWTATVKKPGGCDKPVEVSLENATTRQKAQFSFLMIFGKTRIDFGAVR